MIDVNDTTRVNQLIRTIQNSRIGQSHVIFLGQQLIVGCTCDDGRIKIWNRPFIELSAKCTWSKNVAAASEQLVIAVTEIKNTTELPIATQL